MENLSVEENLYGWQVAKKCPDCTFIVFIHNGKNKDNCISIVEKKYDEGHTCPASKALLDSTLF